MKKVAFLILLFILPLSFLSGYFRFCWANEVEVIKYTQEALDYLEQAYQAQTQEQLRQYLDEAMTAISAAEREALDVGLDSAASYASEGYDWGLKAMQAEDLEEARDYLKEVISILDKVIHASQR